MLFFKGMILILLVNICAVCCIWPPAYSVNLSHAQTFEISDPIEDSDVQDVYDEEEMIKREDLSERQNDKYFRIHQQVRRYNDKYGNDNGYTIDKVKVYKEFNPDIEESAPWKAGFVNEEGKFKQDDGIVYFGLPEDFDTKPKRSEEEVENENNSSIYDYEKFKAEYESNIKAAEYANDTLKYSTVKEEESVKDSVKAMVDFKETPKNCTAEEAKGIGLDAARCFWLEIKKPRMKSHVMEKAVRIVVIWTILYIIVAVPCWCQFGWCCCCCRCKFCKPRQNIAEVQKFFAENPLGVYHDEEGNVLKYKATGYEKYAYRKLEQELNRL